jgi:hypothetical protein
LSGAACDWRVPFAFAILLNASRTVSSVVGVFAPAARWNVAMDDTYRLTVAGVLVSAIASMNLATTSGAAGSDSTPRFSHQAVKMAVSERRARSVLRE